MLKRNLFVLSPLYFFRTTEPKNSGKFSCGIYFHCSQDVHIDNYRLKSSSSYSKYRSWSFFKFNFTKDPISTNPQFSATIKIRALNSVQHRSLGNWKVFCELKKKETRTELKLIITANPYANSHRICKLPWASFHRAIEATAKKQFFDRKKNVKFVKFKRNIIEDNVKKFSLRNV